MIALALDVAFWSHPAVVGLLVGFPSVLLGYLIYRRSVRADEVAAQAGIASTQATSIGQVVDGLNKIIENLREDNDDLRGDVALLRERVEALAGRLDAIRALNIELRERISELEKK